MEKTKHEIYNQIMLDLAQAWENPQNARYWLEKLPDGVWEYDAEFEEIVNRLAAHSRNREKDYYNYAVSDLVEHYAANAKNYVEFIDIAEFDTPLDEALTRWNLWGFGDADFPINLDTQMGDTVSLWDIWDGVGNEPENDIAVQIDDYNYLNIEFERTGETVEILGKDAPYVKIKKIEII